MKHSLAGSSSCPVPRVSCALASMLPALAVAMAATATAQHQWKPMGWPSVRSYHSLSYDPTTSTVLMFGGWDEFERGDTWRWQGSIANWQLVTYSGPSPRHGAPIAYDAARNTQVMFGGYDGGYYNQTWIWSGGGWNQIVPGTSPPARNVHALAYDASRGRVVLFGGYSGVARNDTWEWDGNTWYSPTVVNPPSARYGHSMAYDALSGGVLLFGGSGPSQQTWRWDGTNWTLLAPPQSPPPRYYAAMAADPLHGTIVLHGGTANGSTQLGDTWIWNGVLGTWMLGPDSGPGPRYGHAATFDASRKRIVLVGGEITPSGAPRERRSDVWEWDGATSTWTQAHDTLPNSRIGASATFHADATAAERRVVLFGGRVGPYSSSVVVGDTWLWDGTTWSQPTLSTFPPPRAYSEFVHDRIRDESVLFGGWSPSNLGDTWVWDGAGWLQRSPASSPSARHGHAMAFVPILPGGAGIVLFGGNDGSAKNDLWSWNGTTWTNLIPNAASGSPPTRWHHAMAYDPPNNRLVLFGGSPSGGGAFGDTWAWTPALGWTQLFPQPPSPAARRYSQMQYDPSRGYVVLVAGSNASGTYFQDTWELRGAQWVLCAQTQPPPVRDNHALVYDPDHERLYLFGGYLNPGEFWEAHNPWPAKFEPLAGSVGCAVGAGGSTPTLGVLANSIDNLPWLGSMFRVTLSNQPPTGFPLSVYLFGLPPAIAAPLPWPGCTLYSNFVFSQVTISPAPHTNIGLDIPWQASLLGMEIVCQGGVLNGSNVGMSSAHIATIGARH